MRVLGPTDIALPLVSVQPLEREPGRVIGG